jgi:CRP-like cAMP-binding protein
MAIISRAPRMASLIASGEVRALCIEQADFEELLRLRPETSLAVMRVLCERLREREGGEV